MLGLLLRLQEVQIRISIPKPAVLTEGVASPSMQIKIQDLKLGHQSPLISFHTTFSLIVLLFMRWAYSAIYWKGHEINYEQIYLNTEKDQLLCVRRQT
jgi:hypothetical protein